MDIDTLLNNRFYDVSTSLDEVARDTGLMQGLVERAVWRPRIYLTLLLVFPLFALAFVVAMANGTSENDMPLMLGVPLLGMVALEVTFVTRFFRWVGARFPPRRFLFPLTLLRALNLDRSAPVRVRCALDVFKSTDPLKVAGRLASGVAFDFELAHHQTRKDRTITWFYTANVTLQSAPGSFPRVESLGHAVAQHIRLPGGITPDYVGNTPGALTVRSKIPIEWVLGGNTINNAVLFAAAMIESMHALLLPQVQVVDHQRAIAQPDVRAEVEVEAPKPAGPLLALGAALLLASIGVGAVGYYNYQRKEDLDRQRDALYPPMARAQREASLPYDAGPRGQSSDQYAARYDAWQRAQRAAEARAAELNLQSIELSSSTVPFETRLKRCILLAPAAFLGGVVSLIVGLLRRKRRG